MIESQRGIKTLNRDIKHADGVWTCFAYLLKCLMSTRLRQEDVQKTIFVCIYLHCLVSSPGYRSAAVCLNSATLWGHKRSADYLNVLTETLMYRLCCVHVSYQRTCVVICQYFHLNNLWNMFTDLRLCSMCCTMLTVTEIKGRKIHHLLHLRDIKFRKGGLDDDVTEVNDYHSRHLFNSPKWESLLPCTVAAMAQSERRTKVVTEAT